jgi:hypothetical protein
VGLERCSLSLVSTSEELLGRNSSGFGLENREYDRGDSLRWPRDTLYPQKLALISPTCGGRSVGIVRLRTKATEFVCLYTENVSNFFPFTFFFLFCIYVLSFLFFVYNFSFLLSLPSFSSLPLLFSLNPMRLYFITL